jgi:hypothetical protein
MALSREKTSVINFVEYLKTQTINPMQQDLYNPNAPNWIHITDIKMALNRILREKPHA